MGRQTLGVFFGNWYEDRLDMSRVGKDPRLCRTNAVTDTPIAMARPVDQPFTSLQRDSYRIPRRARPATDVAVCTNQTISYIYNKEHPQCLPTHGPERTLRDLYTSSHSTYGGPNAADSARTWPGQAIISSELANHPTASPARA